MITGTIRTAIGDAPVAELDRCAELIADARDRTIEHLRLALALRGLPAGARNEG